MITEVDFNHYQLQPAPWCFEPGTPNVAGVLGLASALDFINPSIGKRLKPGPVILLISLNNDFRH